MIIKKSYEIKEIYAFDITIENKVEGWAVGLDLSFEGE
jgi:hypothetical protein